MAYRDFKDQSRGVASDEILHDKTFNIANKPKYNEYQREPASVGYKFSDNKSAAANNLSGATKN